jgi:hypothetical protein
MPQQIEKLMMSILALERLHHDMGEIAARQDQNWKFDMVRKRREQSLQLGTLAQDFSQWLSEFPDKDVSQKTQALFNDMRHAISMTQTQWPLSMIDTPDALDRYKQATTETIRNSDEFFEWAKRLMGTK